MLRGGEGERDEADAAVHEAHVDPGGDGKDYDFQETDVVNLWRDPRCTLAVRCF